MTKRRRFVGAAAVLVALGAAWIGVNAQAPLPAVNTTVPGCTAITPLAWTGSTWECLPVPIIPHTITTLPGNYVSGTGTAGVDNTAQVVYTVAVPANTLKTNGDRMLVRTVWRGSTGLAIDGTLAINGVTIATASDVGVPTAQVSEVWLYYIDATHANVLSVSGGVLDTVLTAPNVAGFNWAAAQNITISQNAALDNHLVVYFLGADIYAR